MRPRLIDLFSGDGGCSVGYARAGFEVVGVDSKFGLGAMCRDGVWRQLRRHRLFDTNVMVMRPAGCAHRGEPVGVYGHGGTGHLGKKLPGSRRGYQAIKSEAIEALGVPWMTNRKSISNAIPPAYTQYIGEQLLAHLEQAAA